MEEPFFLELADNEWEPQGIDHDRQIARAIVFDERQQLYFARISRDDAFGRATLIETSGGGVEPGESLEEAIHRELLEELGVQVEIVCALGLVSDYYNLIRRHNLNHYFLCRVLSFGASHRTPEEVRDFHLSTLRLDYTHAVQEYRRCASTKLGRLLAQRELPVLQHAQRILEQMAENDI